MKNVNRKATKPLLYIKKTKQGLTQREVFEYVRSAESRLISAFHRHRVFFSCTGHCCLCFVASSSNILEFDVPRSPPEFFCSVISAHNETMDAFSVDNVGRHECIILSTASDIK